MDIQYLPLRASNRNYPGIRTESTRFGL